MIPKIYCISLQVVYNLSKILYRSNAMAKTTVRPGNPFKNVGGNMPSTTDNPSGNKRGNNPPKKSNIKPTQNKK